MHISGSGSTSGRATSPRSRCARPAASPGRRSAPAAAANDIIREQDYGNFWTYNGPCKGDAFNPEPDRQPLPDPSTPGAAYVSRFFGDAVVRGGRAHAEVGIDRPFGTGQHASRVRLYAGLPRIDIVTDLLNRDERVRYRAVFPTTLAGGTITHEIPFGAIERPAGEFPAQNWIDLSRDGRGLALINRGLPGNAVLGGTLALALLKCTALKEGYGEGGGWKFGTPTEEGFEKGVRHTFQYSLLPHAGDWRAARLWRAGQDVNTPLIAVRVRIPGGHAARPSLAARGLASRPLPDGAEADGRGHRGTRVRGGRAPDRGRARRSGAGGTARGARDRPARAAEAVDRPHRRRPPDGLLLRRRRLRYTDLRDRAAARRRRVRRVGRGALMAAITDRDVFDYHALGRPGKIEVVPTKPLDTQRDLSLAYTPGVARVVEEIERRPEAAFDYTARGNLVAVISNGTAILGLGNRGPLASKPVMEGKAVLFKRFADVDVFDLEIDAPTVDEMVAVVKARGAHLRRHQPRGHQGARVLRGRERA